MAQFSLKNLSEVNEHSVKIVSKESYVFGETFYVPGDWYLNQEPTSEFYVCLTTPKGPPVSQVGSTPSISFRMNLDKEFKGYIFYNRNEFDFQYSSSHLMDALWSDWRLYDQLESDATEDEDGHYIVTMSNNSFSAYQTVAIQFLDEELFNSVSFFIDSPNTTYTKDLETLTVSFCLCPRLDVYTSSPWRISKGQEASIYVEVYSDYTSSVFDPADIEIEFDTSLGSTQVETISLDGGPYTVEGDKYASGYFSQRFIVTGTGSLTILMFYKGTQINYTVYDIS